MEQHRRAWMIAAGAAALVALAACGQDRGSEVALGPPPATRSDVSGTLTRRTRLLAADGTVLHESSDAREVSAVLTRGVARADSGPLLAVIAGVSLKGGAASRTDSAGHRYVVTTAGAGLPGSASVQLDGRLVAEVAFAWTRFGDLDVLTERTTTVYSGGRPVAEERASYRPSRVAHLTESARAEQLRTWPQQPIALVRMDDCGGAWGSLFGAGIALDLAIVAYNIFGAGAASLVASATANYASSFLTLIVCLYMI